MRIGGFSSPLATFFSVVPGLILTVFLAAILISAPVCGLRAVRAARLAGINHNFMINVVNSFHSNDFGYSVLNPVSKSLLALNVPVNITGIVPNTVVPVDFSWLKFR